MAVLGTADAQEGPTVSMGDTYFDPVGLAVEPGTTVRFEVESGTHTANSTRRRSNGGSNG